MGAQQSQDAADRDGNADVIQYLCCRENRSEASQRDKRISTSSSRSPHVSEGLRPSPLQGFNAIDPCPSRDSSVGVPQEVQRYLSGEDRPPLSVGQIHDLGMALAKMHYKKREAVIKNMDSTQLQMCSDAVDFFYDDWENKTQQEKSGLLHSKRCTIDDENNICFLGRPDMRTDFKTNVARVFEHAKAVKIGGKKAKPSKIDTASLQGTNSEKTTPTVTPSGGASIMSQRRCSSADGGTPTGGYSSTPSRGNTPTGHQSPPLLLKRSTGSFKKDKSKEGSSAAVPRAEGDGAAAASPGGAQLKRSSGSFRRSESTKSTTISPKEASGALKRSSGSFKLGAAAPLVKTESLTRMSPLDKAASSPTGNSGKANKSVDFRLEP